MQLFEQDAFCKVFQTQVLTCVPQENSLFEIQLEETAFYPEGGGQPWDTGFIEESEVVEVQKKEGKILHFCTKPLNVGQKVVGTIDWERRYDFMQQHSGEHIVSGIAHKLFGCDNVGFHLGKEVVTIDLNVELTEQQVSHLEQMSNQYIWENHPVEITFPQENTLKSLEYRSKKALIGDVRIVTFPEADCCACCGTHVTHSGQIGLVLLLSCQKFREGVRIELLCGARAFRYLKGVKIQNDMISKMLSAKPLETSAYVQRIVEEKSLIDSQRGILEKKYISLLASSYGGSEPVILFVDDFSPEVLRLLAVEIAQNTSSVVTCFSFSETLFRVAFAVKEGDVRSLTKDLKEHFVFRGGGKANLVQGTISGTKVELETFFQKLLDIK